MDGVVKETKGGAWEGMQVQRGVRYAGLAQENSSARMCWTVTAWVDGRRALVMQARAWESHYVPSV